VSDLSNELPRKKCFDPRQGKEIFLFSKVATHAPSSTTFRLSRAEHPSLSYAITVSIGLSLHTPRSRILLVEILVRFIII
jgi:hypothetical protein